MIGVLIRGNLNTDTYEEDLVETEGEDNDLQVKERSL